MSADEAVVRAEGLAKRFGKAQAVTDATFSVPEGCVFALVGRNGAGKTTTLRMLLGLEPMTGGRAAVHGLDPARKGVEVRRRTGYVPETHHMYRWMRVREVAWFCSAFYPTWNAGLCAELLGRFDLDPQKRVKELSRGMVAKLALTLALAHEPKLLVLDEPTSGLDVIVRREFLESIVDVIAERGRTVVISSHLLADVERVADRVAMIQEGRITQVEDLDDLKARVRAVRVTFTGEPPGSLDLPGMLRLERTGREWLVTVDNFSDETLPRLTKELPGAEFEVRALGLEDVFVAMAGAPRLEAGGGRPEERRDDATRGEGGTEGD